MGDGVQTIPDIPQTNFLPVLGPVSTLVVAILRTLACQGRPRSVKVKTRLAVCGYRNMASKSVFRRWPSQKRAVMHLPPGFDISKNGAVVESASFDGPAFSESLMLDSIPNYRPFDLVDNRYNRLSRYTGGLDGITIGFGEHVGDGRR